MDYILPASCLFSKTKITLEEVAEQWDSGTVLVMKKPNGSIGFIAGAGGGGYANDMGQRMSFAHDQTHANMGIWEVLDEIVYKTVDGKFTVIKSLSAGTADLKYSLQTKGTIAVFK